ncbi:PEP/pyruvate-binding domain-containing protein [Gottfriedia sp. NPDC057991]|uniref:PEP/pyruvate-binding domain-containing protein n=1 Tax=Gottfriedia sp. NPDC057991 TaxID=3346298 RepID=UPI0036D977A8
MSIVTLCNGVNYDLSLIGSKAMNLSKMAILFDHIPDGFILTGEVFKAFLSINNIETTNNERIQSEILQGEFPDQMKRYILMNFEGLKSNTDTYAVAVRSSSALEDLRGASFAGQYETILNVRSEEELLHSIKRCWASYFSTYVQEYAKKNQISLSDVKMGVLVQGMVDADVAGVIFSMNPVTFNKQEIIINASYGLGESVVDGLVTPDLFVLNKESELIIKELGLKEIQVIPLETGMEKAEVPPSLQEVFCLEDEKIMALMDITKKIENYYQHPVDIEFAIKNDQLYILQVRPITTLKGEN